MFGTNKTNALNFRTNDLTFNEIKNFFSTKNSFNGLRQSVRESRFFRNTAEKFPWIFSQK